MWRPYSLNYHDYISLVYRIAHMSFKGDLLHAELSLFNASLRVLDNFMDAYEAYRTADAERRRNGGRFLLRFSDLDEIRKAKSEQVADMRSEEQADLPL
jgi:hypothetical protein